MKEWLGRQQVYVKNELPKGLQEKSKINIRQAVKVTDSVYCQRCGSTNSLNVASISCGLFYCTYCIQYGRLTNRHVLVSIEEPKKMNMDRHVHFAWEGYLTRPQKQVANAIIENYLQGKHSLIWAVTGSGKTEMIFPLLLRALSQGKRVGVTSPRIDVCRELYPRIKAAFPKENILLLHGQSPESYRYSELTISTTHQLLHFYRAFDLLIIDEIDAFPYEGNSQLRFAVKQAIKPQGQYIYLTATPSKKLLQEIAGSFEIQRLPIRFHRRPLIVPELIWYERWESCGNNYRKTRKLLRYLKRLSRANAVLVFCPSIAFMKNVYQMVARYFDECQVACVSSQDAERELKVQHMREGKFQVLLTSTILERGVTFERVSVIVLGANHPIFTKSVLVQIAGRVDRKGDYHHGQVIFFYNQQTSAIRQAVREIKEMNSLAMNGCNDEM